jgi:hypothetical protein
LPHRPVSGSLRLRRGVFLRYRVDVSRQWLALSVGQNQPWHTHTLARTQGRWAASCAGGEPGCTGRAEILCWSFSRAQDRPDRPGLCHACTRLRYLSETHSGEVAALRADLRVGALDPVHQALSGTDYVAARTAMELEGLIPDPKRRFTLPSGHRRRWAHLHPE